MNSVECFINQQKPKVVFWFRIPLVIKPKCLFSGHVGEEGMEEKVVHSTLVGPYLYMPPEQVIFN